MSSHRFRIWPQPSLARRAFYALLAAFVVAWLVLTLIEYRDLNSHDTRNRELDQAASIILAGLFGLDRETAAAVLAANERQINAARKLPPLSADDLLLLVATTDALVDVTEATEAMIFVSEPLRPHASALLADAFAPMATLEIGGTRYWWVGVERDGWRIWLLEPVHSGRDLLSVIASELAPSIVIAFPFVLIPIWLAIRSGLAPLRGFAEEVHARHSHDFSPLDTRHLGYAELQPLSAAFDALLTRARDNIARERAFVQDAAHELRTPLAVLATQAHILSRASDDEARAAARAALESAVGRASHLTRQLLALAALEGHRSPQAQDVDLVKLARDILIAANPAATARRIDVALDSPDRLVHRIDPAAFHSILDNLLGNALAYTPEGAQVVVGLTRSGGVTRLAVADDGPGIDTAERERVFERFYRGRSVTARGSGLGLAIVRQAVANSGGTIVLGPGLAGRGVCFTIEWPPQPTAGGGSPCEGASPKIAPPSDAAPRNPSAPTFLRASRAMPR